MLTKIDSYLELREKGLRITPVIIWFDRTQDDMIDAYVLLNGTEEVRYNIHNNDIPNIHMILPYEMTVVARMRWLRLTNEDEFAIYMESVQNILKDCIQREYHDFIQPISFTDSYCEDPIPTYTRHFFEQFLLKAVFNPTYQNECKLTYVWRSTEFESLQHVMKAIAIDYEILRLITKN